MKTTKLKMQTDGEGVWLSALVAREDALFALQNVEQGQTYELEVKKAKGKKRSLDANSYAWVLMDKLAAYYGIRVNDVYRDAVREVGGNSEIVCLRNEAVDVFCKGWERNGIGWQTELMPPKLEGCTNVKIYYGSSTYDTAQMSRLIDIIVQDCKLAGIEVISEKDKALLLDEWGGKG